MLQKAQNASALPIQKRTPLKGKRGVWAASILITLATCVVYSHSLHCPFVFDDMTSIPQNPSIRHLWPLGAALSPPAEGITVEGRPIANLSLALCYSAGGLDVRWYHAFNLLVHLLAGLTLFGVVRRTLLLQNSDSPFSLRSTVIAATSALLWVLHPLQTESVTYVVQRTESLMGLFYLLTLYCVIRGAQAGRPLAWHMAAVAACALGMGCKEVMASAPLIILCYDRVFLSGSFRESLTKRWRLYVGLLTTWAILVAGLVSSKGHSVSVGVQSTTVTPLEYAMTQCEYLVRYVGLAFWPRPLVFDYGYPDAGVPVIRSLWGCTPWNLGVLLGLAATAIGVRYWPKIGFLGVWFFVLLGPTSSFLPIFTEVAAEHRMYLPLAAVAAGAVLLAYKLVLIMTQSASGSAFRRKATLWVACATVVLVAIALGAATFIRNQDYQSELTIWRDTVAKRPHNARAHLNLGNSLSSLGQEVPACQEFRLAIAAKPDYAEAYCNLGDSLSALGSRDEALSLFEEALRLQKDLPWAHNDRGNALVALGKVKEGIDELTTAITLKPSYAEAYVNRGAAYETLNQQNQAIADYTKAIELDPDLAAAYGDRGNAFVALKRYREALADYDRAIENHIRVAATYINRGNIQILFGQYGKAVESFTEGLSLDANSTDAYKNRALAWFNLKAYDSAWADVKSCHRLGGAVNPKLLEMLSRASGRGEP